MKPENMVFGMKVVVKKCARGYAKSKVGCAGVLSKYSPQYDVWIVETEYESFGVFANEVRKVKDGCEE